MKLLAIDTSTDYLSLAVMNDGKIISRFHEKAKMRHSKMLIPMIDRLLKKVRLKIEDIDGFCISIGPGSFTGLRIGVTCVKGLAYVLNKPIAAVPTLDVIAQNVKGYKGIICPVIDAKKEKVYTSLYKCDGNDIKKISKYLLVPIKDLMKTLAKYDKVFFLGDGLSLIGKAEKFKWHPRADVVAKIGSEYFKDRRFTPPEDLEPLYIYSSRCDITGR